MPILRFILENRSFSHEESAQSVRRTLSFDAAMSNNGTVRIESNGKRFNGLETICYVIATERRLPHVMPTEDDAAERASEISIAADPVAYFHFSDPYSDAEHQKNFPAHLVIGLTLAQDTFQILVDANTDSSIISLRVDTPLHDKALTYGFAPDGSEIEWNVDISRNIYPTEFTVAVLPRPPVAAEPSKLTKIAEEPPRLETPKPVVDLSRVTVLMNRLVWVTALIVVLLLVVIVRHW